MLTNFFSRMVNIFKIIITLTILVIVISSFIILKDSREKVNNFPSLFEKQNQTIAAVKIRCNELKMHNFKLAANNVNAYDRLEKAKNDILKLSKEVWYWKCMTTSAEYTRDYYKENYNKTIKILEERNKEVEELKKKIKELEKTEE